MQGSKGGGAYSRKEEGWEGVASEEGKERGEEG